MTIELLEESGDIELWAGADAPPVMWEILKEDVPDDEEAPVSARFDLFGSTVLLTISRGKALVLTKDSEEIGSSLTVDYVKSWVSWQPTLEETRSLLPRGRICRYELERRIDGRQEKLAFGSVRVRGGLNVD